MPVLREIVAKLTLDLDKKAFDQADKEISGLTRGLNFAGTAAVALTAALGVGLGFAVKTAADANETLNLMGLTFKDNTDEVVRWAAAFSDAAGRSEFELREMATTLGSVLTPLLDNNIDQAAEFAQALSARAVDFASARNVKDLEATQAFISGLTGETEPLKRFGIIMTVASLDAFALAKGISKSTMEMSEAEKTQLRYAFLMERTSVFQGDAANTSESFANATKALLASVTDAGTRIGLRFLPAAEAFVRGARDAADVLGDWFENTQIIQAALIVFGTIATAVAIRAAAAWALVNLPIVLTALALAALVLIVEDFLTFMQGGPSVIGDFINHLFGPGSAHEAAVNLRLAWEGLVLSGRAMFGMLGELGSAVGEFFIRNEAVFTDWSVGVGKALGLVSDGTNIWAQGVKSAFDFVDIMIERSTKLFTDWGSTVLDTFAAVADFVGIDSGGFSATVRGRQGLGDPSIPSPATAPAANGAGSQVVHQSVSVTVPAGTAPDMARRVAGATSTAVGAQNRRARAALTQRATSG